ncbi:MAG TPA: flagellar biosynthetic protein FliO [Dongiaceae bacterium]|nr:flagellar biosynthetic protein FliO [Dongiaceae bacterium]
MDGESYLRFVLALVLVLGLLALAAFFLRRSGIGPKLGRGRRLSVVETLPLGPRHRLILVRRDDVEHLVLIGPQGDVVVESGVSGHAGLPAERNSLAQSHAQFDNALEPEAKREPSLRPFAEVLEDRSGADAGNPYTTSSNERN